MKQHLKHVTLVVRDYDEAIEFYTRKLNFDLIEDSRLSAAKRWVLVRSKGTNECCLLLAKAATDAQKSRIGNQTGGRVFLFLYTDDFERDYQNLITHQIKIIREPTVEAYGKVAVFEDLYGNLWDLIAPETGKQSLHYTTELLRVENQDQCKPVYQEIIKIAAVIKQKKSTLSFEVYQSKNRPPAFIIQACFKDKKACTAYLNSTYLKRLIAKTGVTLATRIVSEKIH